MLEKKTEAIHLWSDPSTASNALRIEATGQLYEQTTEFVHLGGAISENADLDTEIKRPIGAAWASDRIYGSQLHYRRNSRLSLKIILFKAEVVEAMLYGCATWTTRSQDFSSLRTAHHNLFLRVIGFRRKNRTRFKPLLYGEVLERIDSEHIETTIRKRQLRSSGALIRQGNSRLSKRNMFERLAMEGPKRGGRSATSWVDCLQKNLEAFGATPRKGKGRKWVAFGVVVKDGRDWMIAAKNVGMWHRGSRGKRKHLRTPRDARTFANPTCGARARLVGLYSNCVCDFVLFCLVAVVVFVFFLRYAIGEPGMGFAPVLSFGRLTSLDAFPCVQGDRSHPSSIILFWFLLCVSIVSGVTHGVWGTKEIIIYRFYIRLCIRVQLKPTAPTPRIALNLPYKTRPPRYFQLH